MDYKEIGARIQKERKALNLTQENVAENTGISTSFYSHIENGSRHASLLTYVKITDYLDTSLDYIIKNKNKRDEITDEYTKQIVHRIKNFSNNERTFVLDFINALKKFEK